MLKMQSNIRSGCNVRAVSREIASCLGRGSVTEAMTTTVLNGIKELATLKHLKHLTQTHIDSYVASLQEKVKNGELTGKTTSTYVSALNAVINHTNKHIDMNYRNLKTVSAQENGLAAGSAGPVLPTVSAKVHNQYKTELEDKYKQTGDISHEALKHIVTIARSTGLRIRECISTKFYEKDITKGTLELTKGDGTKNSRPRDVALTNEAVNDINNAKQFMKENNLSSLCTKATRQQMSNFVYNSNRAFERHSGEKYSFHMERRVYAQNQYKEYRKQGLSDQEARLKVSESLGHNRIDVTYRYIPK